MTGWVGSRSVGVLMRMYAFRLFEGWVVDGWEGLWVCMGRIVGLFVGAPVGGQICCIYRQVSGWVGRCAGVFVQI